MTRKFNEAGVVILIWLLANLLGVALVGALSFIAPFINFMPGMLVSSLIIGLPIGLAQWVVLRRVAPISPLWIFTIAVALPLGLLVLNSPLISGIWGIFGDDESVLSLMAGYSTIGLLVGLVQWLFLRVHFTKSSVWLLSSAIGLGLGTALVIATSLIYQSGIISISLVVLVYAIATGSVISWMQVSSGDSGNHLVDAT
ncbi:MAG: hypothetical protein PVF85_05415 [Anaerolineales bacterium]|jgi:hypothetical protein